MVIPMPICRRLLTQEIFFARSLAAAKAGNNIAARIAIMAMTTSSSIKVKPFPRRLCRAAGHTGPTSIFNGEFIFCMFTRDVDRVLLPAGYFHKTILPPLLGLYPTKTWERQSVRWQGSLPNLGPRKRRSERRIEVKFRFLPEEQIGSSVPTLFERRRRYLQ